jgi:hypothetical protein
MRYRLTLALLAVGFLATVGSYYTYQSPLLGHSPFGELYPFFHWSLFSRPHGYQGYAEHARIRVSQDGQQWQTQTPGERSTFSRIQYMYLLRYYSGLAKKGKVLSPVESKKLLLVCQTLEPGWVHYQIVSERIEPVKSLDPIAIDVLAEF